MSFITERYSVAQRKSGKFGLCGKYGWYKEQNAAGEWKAVVFDTFTEAAKFAGMKRDEEMAERKAKSEEKAAMKAKVAKFMKDNGITPEMEKTAIQGMIEKRHEDGTVTLKRVFNTATGKKAVIAWNNGFTRRSWNCVTLYVDGVVIFTSGHIEKVVEYIITH